MLLGCGILQVSYWHLSRSDVVSDVKVVSAEMKRWVKLLGTDGIIRGRFVVKSIVAVDFGCKELIRFLGSLFSWKCR
jgi:hypothetical protein